MAQQCRKNSSTAAILIAEISCCLKAGTHSRPAQMAVYNLETFFFLLVEALYGRFFLWAGKSTPTAYCLALVVPRALSIEKSCKESLLTSMQRRLLPLMRWMLGHLSKLWSGVSTRVTPARYKLRHVLLC